jgi:WD40 repeat protein
MSNRILRTLARLALAGLILAALVGVVRSLTASPPTLLPRLSLEDSAGYLVASFAPDSRTLVGVSIRVENNGSHWAGPLRLWDATTGRVKATVANNVKFCTPPLRFSPDSKFMAIEGPGVFKVWETDSGAERINLAPAGNQFGRANFDFTPDSRTLAVGNGRTRTIQLWDLTAGKERATLEGALPPLQFTPDGSTLAAAWERGVKLWDVATGQVKATLPGKDFRTEALAFAPDGKTLVAGTLRTADDPGQGTEEVRIWDMPGGMERAVLPLKQKVHWFSFSRDGSVLLAWDYNLAPIGWDLTAVPLQPLSSAGPGGMWQPTPDGKTLVNHTPDGVVLWDVVAGKVRARFWAPAHYYNTPCVSPDGRHILVQAQLDDGSWLQSILGGPAAPAAPVDGGQVETQFVSRLFDATTGQTRAVLEHAGFTTFSPQGQTMASSWGMEGICLWDVPQGDSDRGLVLSLIALGVLLVVALGWWGFNRIRLTAAPATSPSEA